MGFRKITQNGIEISEKMQPNAMPYIRTRYYLQKNILMNITTFVIRVFKQLHNVGIKSIKYLGEIPRP